MTATPTTAPTPTPPYAVDELTIEDGLEIAMWQTPGPWAVQDDLAAPDPDQGFWAVRDADRRLIGYAAFGKDARPMQMTPDAACLDVALGLAPQYAGRNLSGPFARTVVERARSVSDGRRLRAVVASWNAVGRHAAESAGFALKGTHDIQSSSGATSYYVYEM